MALLRPKHPHQPVVLRPEAVYPEIEEFWSGASRSGGRAHQAGVGAPEPSMPDRDEEAAFERIDADSGQGEGQQDEGGGGFGGDSSEEELSVEESTRRRSVRSPASDGSREVERDVGEEGALAGESERPTASRSPELRRGRALRGPTTARRRWHPPGASLGVRSSNDASGGRPGLGGAVVGAALGVAAMSLAALVLVVAARPAAPDEPSQRLLAPPPAVVAPAPAPRRVRPGPRLGKTVARNARRKLDRVATETAPGPPRRASSAPAVAPATPAGAPPAGTPSPDAPRPPGSASPRAPAPRGSDGQEFGFER